MSWGMPKTRSAVVPSWRVALLPRAHGDARGDVELGLDHGPERAERVEALGPAPLSVGALQIARGHVVGHGVAQHRLHGVLDRHAPRHAADDHGQLSLVVDLPG